MTARTQDYSDWIGRTEETADLITAAPLDRFSATLDRNDPAHGDGAVVPPLAHWLYFLSCHPGSALGPDGHARRGGFLPPVDDLPRRMWAGSRVVFHGDLKVGMHATRKSTISAVQAKTGSLGPLVFVTVRHEVFQSGPDPLITDEHDIVYRGIDGPVTKPPVPSTEAADWQRALVPDDVLLFRYSALTFNGHRIHYDRRYVTQVEGYPGLVVHGPLIATLLVDLVRRNLPDRRVERFSFRALSPVFDGEALSVKGRNPDPHGRTMLWAENAAGGMVMKAEAVVTAGTSS